MRGPDERKNQGTADQTYDHNILGDTRTSERAGRKSEKCEENIGDPAHDSQTSSGATVNAMKEIQGTDQRHCYAGTEEPDPESGRRR